MYNPGIGQSVKRIDERPRIAHANACNAMLDLELTGPVLIGLTGFLNNLNSDARELATGSHPRHLIPTPIFGLIDTGVSPGQCRLPVFAGAVKGDPKTHRQCEHMFIPA